MESIEEQWNPPTSTDILSDSWMDIASAKKAAKTWILDRGESWAPTDQTTKSDSNFIAFYPLALFTLESRLKIAFFELHLILHTIALHLHTPILNHGTQHGIYQAL
jgi:hypothetical protein